MENTKIKPTEPIKAINTINVDQSGKRKAGDALSELFTGIKSNQVVLHDYELMYQCNQRQGNASTKDRSEVRGGGRKPWKQKGTGRARHGSSRSPIWISGGVTFGPRKRDFSQVLPKQTRNNALKVSVLKKAKDAKFLIVEKFEIPSGKTKDCQDAIKKMNLNRPLIIIQNDGDHKTLRAIGNLQKTNLKRVMDLCAHDILICDDCVITTAAYDQLISRLTAKKNTLKQIKDIK
ncbi:MAG: large subunit ribosomal protein L4 [Candidatus Omnitrophota bacterium]|jgi:large subunit ribosomal protein L4